MTEPKLKPCPFCGGEAKVYRRIFDWETWDYKVECSKCHCAATENYDTKQEAIEEWNTRVAE